MSSAGGIEEDFIKCLGHTYVGDFHLKGSELRSKGINRIGNLLVPNDNYCKFEDWLMPILDQMLIEQNTEVQYNVVQYKSKETPQLIGLFSPNLVITNFMQCFLYGPIG